MGNMDFPARAIEILSPDSPLFFDLWPHIIQAAEDDDVFINLALTCRYFYTFAKSIRTQRKSDQVKDKFIKIREFEEAGHAERAYGSDYRSRPNPLRLDPHSVKPLWYSWGADKCGFSSHNNFLEFCKIAGVEDPDKEPGGARWNHKNWPSHSFLSADGKVSFECWRDPREPERKGYVHYLGCTGEYGRAKELEDWFRANGDWEDICIWRRDYI